MQRQHRLEWREDVFDWENGRPWHLFVDGAATSLCGSRRWSWDVVSGEAPSHGACTVCSGLFNECLQRAVPVGAQVELQDTGSDERMRCQLVASLNTRHPLSLDGDLVLVSADSDLGIALTDPFRPELFTVGGVTYRVISKGESGVSD